MTRGDLEAEKEKLFALIVVAQNQQASVETASAALKAEREALAHERKLFRRELEHWPIVARQILHSAVQTELANSAKESVATAQAAVAPMVAQMSRVAELATAAENAAVNVVGWFDSQIIRWIKLLIPAGFIIGLFAMLLAWVISSWRVHWDSQAIGEMLGKKQQAEMELRTAQENLAAWKQKYHTVEPIPCGLPRKFWCVFVYTADIPTSWGLPNGWRVLKE